MDLVLEWEGGDAAEDEAGDDDREPDADGAEQEKACAREWSRRWVVYDLEPCTCERLYGRHLLVDGRRVVDLFPHRFEMNTISAKNLCGERLLLTQEAK